MGDFKEQINTETDFLPRACDGALVPLVVQRAQATAL